MLRLKSSVKPMNERKYTTLGLEEATDTIVDVIACADGGASFLTLLSIIRQVDAEDSDAARSVIDIILKFGRLCKLAERQVNKSM